MILTKMILLYRKKPYHLPFTVSYCRNIDFDAQKKRKHFFLFSVLTCEMLEFYFRNVMTVT